MGREAHIKNSSDGGRLPAGHGIGGIKAIIMELRLPLCGPAEQPLDAVLRRCNTFHFISFHFAICTLALLTQLTHLSCHIPFLKEVTRCTRTTSLFGRGYRNLRE